MAQLAASIVSHDDEFKRQIATLLRSCGVPVGIVEDRRAGVEGGGPDVVVVDIRADASSGMAAIERLRAGHPTVAVFAIAAVADPDLILQAMRAGANEFFPWTSGGTQARSMEESFHSAVRRAAARHAAASAGARQPCATHVFLGAKGGAGTTTVAVNCAVELARLTKRPTAIIDLKPSLGEVALFLGVRPRFTVLDAIENLHRLDREFLRELMAKHKSDLDILAGSEQFDRPNQQDASAMEELLRALSRLYDHLVIDAGNMLNGAAVSALYAADTIFLVTNPDVPSIRNAQRLVDRVRQLGAGSERVKVLLNRVSDQNLIAPKQIETALGYGIHQAFSSDYRTVSTALNSGVPLSLSNHSELAAQFSTFTRHLLGVHGEEAKPEPERRRAFLGIL
ncbi:MAG TPA: AAA family ATPase [Vicinamibacterales bacterium]|jgi:pilus assembly protein CpaE|nr:AAA family ATPase [Vicinamibacterales bacterium]